MYGRDRRYAGMGVAAYMHGRPRDMHAYAIMGAIIERLALIPCKLRLLLLELTDVNVKSQFHRLTKHNFTPPRCPLTLTLQISLAMCVMPPWFDLLNVCFDSQEYSFG